MPQERCWGYGCKLIHRLNARTNMRWVDVSKLNLASVKIFCNDDGNHLKSVAAAEPSTLSVLLLVYYSWYTE